MRPDPTRPGRIGPGGYPVEPFTELVPEERARPSAVNWGGVAESVNDQTFVTVFDFRYDGEPETWALTIEADPPTAALVVQVRYGSGGAFRVTPLFATGTYLVHGSDVRVDIRMAFGRVFRAFLSHGAGAPTIP